jgi:hypothetical protein
MFLCASVGQIVAAAAGIELHTRFAKEFSHQPMAVVTEEIPAISARLRFGNNRGRLAALLPAAVRVEQIDVLAGGHVSSFHKVERPIPVSAVGVCPLDPTRLVCKQSGTHPGVQVKDGTLFNSGFPAVASPT